MTKKRPGGEITRRAAQAAMEAAMPVSWRRVADAPLPKDRAILAYGIRIGHCRIHWNGTDWSAPRVGCVPGGTVSAEQVTHWREVDDERFLTGKD